MRSKGYSVKHRIYYLGRDKNSAEDGRKRTDKRRGQCVNRFETMNIILEVE